MEAIISTLVILAFLVVFVLFVTKTFNTVVSKFDALLKDAVNDITNEFNKIAGK